MSGQCGWVVRTPIGASAAAGYLANAIDPRYQALILLAVFCGLRWGELAALRRRHIDLAAQVLRVEASMAELTDGSLITGPPKSAAGKRLISIPASIRPDVAAHLDLYTCPGNDSLVLIGPKNAPLRRSNFTRTWRQVTLATGLTSFHFHDLRHTGNDLAAATGASLRELMDRMGHSTTRAALIYQHTSAERDRRIADGISKLADAGRRRSKSRSATQRARKPRRAS